ncbi:MAG: tyrosine-protein phosphatase [Candidatus Dadabacteria bacterium]|nr:MAG: tyrosine-protein phosphatase [Candidatus Dadabacteria bacterium]
MKLSMRVRRIELEGAFNVRDLGGYRAAGGKRVATGRVFRADALHRLSERDERRLETLGICRVFDLRSAVELARHGVGEFERRHGYVHAPLVEVTLDPFDPAIDWERINLPDRYLEMLESGGGVIRRILETLAGETNGAVLFHCTGGKDRTGVVAAVLLRALGVADEDIVADYALSERCLAGVVERYRAELERMGLKREAIEYLTSSAPERMRYTLQQWDRRWGSTEGYLDAIGFGQAQRQALRSRLLV